MIFETFLLKHLYNKDNEGFDVTTTIDTIGYTLLFVYLFIIFIYSFGAAKLSWSYGSYIGNGIFMRFIWALLSFLFASLYYPMYAYFLNPIGKMPRLHNVSKISKNL
jgi:hypothetical protein